MKPLSLYYLAFSKEDPAGMIIYTQHPYECGRVILYNSHLQMITGLQEHKPLAYSIVPGYNITINYAGNITGRKIEVEADTVFNIQRQMAAMAKFYFEFRIEDKRSYYDRKFSTR